MGHVGCEIEDSEEIKSGWDCDSNRDQAEGSVWVKDVITRLRFGQVELAKGMIETTVTSVQNGRVRKCR